jgi:diol dehydratase reactivase alpha subunit
MSAQRLVVGVDIGNSTTEACLADVSESGAIQYLGSWLTRTTGVKGTLANFAAVREAVQGALHRGGIPKSRRPDLVLINEATPVISGIAMETITETIITESTMMGHNPATPGGGGLGLGRTVAFSELAGLPEGDRVIAVIGRDVNFTAAAAGLSRAMERGVDVQGAIVQRDDARLIANRLPRPLPVIDEVAGIDRVPLGMEAAVEVAMPGHTIRHLSNPYGLASLFGLDAEQTRRIAPVSRALIGLRSAVVVRTPLGEVHDRRIPAGVVTLHGERSQQEVDVADGADTIMKALYRVRPLKDVQGEAGTNVGGMLARVRESMAELHGLPHHEVRISDLLAVNTFVPQEVRGGLSGEFALENAVGLAAMVRTSRGPMERLAQALGGKLGCQVRVGGVEAEMALRGALTTPGTRAPLALLDLGGGSTDAAYVSASGEVYTVHVAGAGDLVTHLIQSELGLDDQEAAENLKRYPLAKVESPFQIRLEDGSVRFFPEPLPAALFARVVTLDGGRPIAAVPGPYSVEHLRQVRREAKRKVFVVNALRALEQVAPGNNLRLLEFVVLLGGSALDFEIPAMISAASAEYGFVCGAGNIRNLEGPRNAVATGLVVAFGEAPNAA